MVEALLANPALTHQEMAQQFGFASRSWVSQIIASEVFQAALARRRAELLAPVEEQCQALMSRSLNVLQAKLDRPVDEIADQLVLRVFEIGMKVLGFGTGPLRTPSPQVNVVQHLEELSTNLVVLLRRQRAEAGHTIDADPVSPTPVEK